MQNGLRHVFWTMILVLTTETGPMEQVLVRPTHFGLYYSHLNDERLRFCKLKELEMILEKIGTSAFPSK